MKPGTWSTRSSTLRSKAVNREAFIFDTCFAVAGIGIRTSTSATAKVCFTLHYRHRAPQTPCPKGAKGRHDGKELTSLLQHIGAAIGAQRKLQTYQHLAAYPRHRRRGERVREECERLDYLQQ